jgi:flagellar biosynthesis/type III secretory pathway protein FliH
MNQKEKLFHINFDEQKLLEMSIGHGEHQYAADFRIGFRKGFNRGKEAGFQAGLEYNSELLLACDETIKGNIDHRCVADSADCNLCKLLKKLRSRNGGGVK